MLLIQREKDVCIIVSERMRKIEVNVFRLNQTQTKFMHFKWDIPSSLDEDQNIVLLQRIKND